MSLLQAAKSYGKAHLPGLSSAQAIKGRRYKDAAKHAVSDAAFWSTIALPDYGMVSGPAVKYATDKVLFPKRKEKAEYGSMSHVPGYDSSSTESGKKVKKAVKKIKEAVRDYRFSR
jgi:hypothetical protein